MKNIIDDPINKNIELYYAFFQFVSIITLQKYQLLKHVKRIIKNQMKNSYQNPITYKKVNRLYPCSPFYK